MDTQFTNEVVEEAIRARVPDAGSVSVSGLAELPGGFSRETWMLESSIESGSHAGSHRLIIRRDPDASVLESNLAMEYSLLRDLERAGIKVPHVWFLDDTGGRTFLLLDRIEGGTADVRGLSALGSDERAKLTADTVATLAMIHGLNVEDFPLLDDEFRAIGPDVASREIEDIRNTFDRVRLEPHPILEMCLDWLAAHVPPDPQRQSLVHGDYRIGNIFYSPTGELLSVFDWELARFGDPAEDLAWFCMRMFRYSGDDRVCGLCTREELLSRYEDASNTAIDRGTVMFWELLGNVRMAVIQLTGGRAFVDGATSNPAMALSGRLVDNQTLLALEILRDLELGKQ